MMSLNDIRLVRQNSFLATKDAKYWHVFFFFIIKVSIGLKSQNLIELAKIISFKDIFYSS